MSRRPGPSRYEGSSFTPAPPPEPMIRQRDDRGGYEVLYYQDAQDFRGREYYDNYAFGNPDAYYDWRHGGQPARAVPPSTMPQPRFDAYPPYHAGPSGWNSPNWGPSIPPSGPSSRPYSTDNSGRGGSYVPPQRRNENAGVSRYPSSLPAKPPSQPAFRERRSTTPPFVIPLPEQAYMELSKPDIPSNDRRFMDEGSQKLLVLDLNGTLIYRNKGTGTGRTSYPRPYLGSFLEYLMQPEADDTGRRLNKWSVFVWSSAQPHNVRGMLESTFDRKHIDGLWAEENSEPGEGQFVKGKVLGVWARDKMGLSAHDYANKTQTVKDLRKVVDHFAAVEGLSETHFRLQDILLLDDSPRKAVHQPWNQVVLPEYDRSAYQESRDAVSRGKDGRPASGCDEYLLAIIGILEELKSVSNVPAWIRAGGLKKPNVYETPDEWDAPTGDWCGVPDGPAAGQRPHLDELPSHESFDHWFESASTAERWIQKGKAALETYGIPINHGINTNASVGGTPGPKSKSPEPVLRGPSRRLATGHNGPQQRRRGYSPSQPMEDESSGNELAGLTRSLSIEREDERPSFGSVAEQTRSNMERPRPRSPSRDGQTRSFTTVNPNPNITFNPVSEAFDPARPIDTWRTLRSADVSRWLADFADRASLDEQARTLVHQTGDLLRSVGTGETWDRRMPPEILAIAGWHDNMTNEEMQFRGQLKALRKTREMVQEADDNGMPPCPMWERGGQKRLQELEKALKRGDTRPKAADGTAITIPRKVHDHINQAILLNATTDETLDFPAGAGLEQWSQKLAKDARKAKAHGQASRGGHDDGPSIQSHASGPHNGDVRDPAPPDRVAGQGESVLQIGASANGDHAGDKTTGDHIADRKHDKDYTDTLAAVSQYGHFAIKQHPTDYPSSSLDLPECRINGRLVTPEELARVFARAACSPDVNERRYLKEIRQKEKLILSTSRKCRPEARFADLKRVERLRGWLVQAEDHRAKQNERSEDWLRVVEECRARGERPPPPPPPLPAPTPKKREKDPERQKSRKERMHPTRLPKAERRAKKNKGKNKHKNRQPQVQPQEPNANTNQRKHHQPQPTGTSTRAPKRKAAEDAASAIQKVIRLEGQ